MQFSRFYDNLCVEGSQFSRIPPYCTYMRNLYANIQISRPSPVPQIQSVVCLVCIYIYIRADLRGLDRAIIWLPWQQPSPLTFFYHYLLYYSAVVVNATKHYGQTDREREADLGFIGFFVDPCELSREQLVQFRQHGKIKIICREDNSSLFFIVALFFRSIFTIFILHSYF